MIEHDHIRAVAEAQLNRDPEGAGAALCVIIDGEVAINAQWGLADARSGRPYDRSTLHYPMSMSKGVVAALLALLIDRGLLDPAERVAHYWPEFAAAGKQDVTVAQLMSHRAGVPLLDGGYSIGLLNDRERFAARLAAQRPLWEPGTRFGYHSWTFGNYADFLFERASGRTTAELLGELRAMLGIEIYQGVPREHWHRVVRLMWPPQVDSHDPQAMLAGLDPDGMPYKLATNFPETFEAEAFYGGEAIRTLASPADSLFGTAYSYTTLFAFLAAGGIWQGRRLCSAEAIATVTAEQVRGTDAVIGGDMAFGLGFQKPSGLFPFSPSPTAFGHAGAGGTIGFADPEARIAVVWLPTYFSTADPDPRWRAISAAIYAELRP